MYGVKFIDKRSLTYERTVVGAPFQINKNKLGIFYSKFGGFSLACIDKK